MERPVQNGFEELKAKSDQSIRNHWRRVFCGHLAVLIESEFNYSAEEIVGMATDLVNALEDCEEREFIRLEARMKGDQGSFESKL